MTHLCSFSGEVSYLSKKDKRDAVKVLRVLKQDPRVSCFDMGEDNLWKTILELERRGLVKHIRLPYPWNRYKITLAGIRYLETKTPST